MAEGRKLPTANLDLVRSIYANWERGDFSSTGWAHPEIELVFVDGPAPGSWRGLAGMAEGFRDFLAAWEGYEVKAEEYRELDDDRVLVLIRLFGRGKTSGVELGQMQSKSANLLHVGGGKVSRVVIYLDRERALADLGLAPDGRSLDSGP